MLCALEFARRWPEDCSWLTGRCPSMSPHTMDFRLFVWCGCPSISHKTKNSCSSWTVRPGSTGLVAPHENKGQVDAHLDEVWVFTFAQPPAALIWIALLIYMTCLVPLAFEFAGLGIHSYWVTLDQWEKSLLPQLLKAGCPCGHGSSSCWEEPIQCLLFWSPAPDSYSGMNETDWWSRGHVTMTS